MFITISFIHAIVLSVSYEELELSAQEKAPPILVISCQYRTSAQMLLTNLAIRVGFLNLKDNAIGSSNAHKHSE